MIIPVPLAACRQGAGRQRTTVKFAATIDKTIRKLTTVTAPRV
jgi:hypothetical protein